MPTHIIPGLPRIVKSWLRHCHPPPPPPPPVRPPALGSVMNSPLIHRLMTAFDLPHKTSALTLYPVGLSRSLALSLTHSRTISLSGVLSLSFLPFFVFRSFSVAVSNSLFFLCFPRPSPSLMFNPALPQKQPQTLFSLYLAPSFEADKGAWFLLT